MKISNRYRKKAERYLYFSRYWHHMLDLTEDSLIECYNWESFGHRVKSTNNAYVVGKSWMDVNITIWKEDIANGLLLPEELEELQNLL